MRRSMTIASVMLAGVLVGCSSSRVGDMAQHHPPVEPTVKTAHSSFSVAGLRKACEQGLRVDLDGDGIEDRAAHTYIDHKADSEPVLTVCLSTGEAMAIEGVGQAEGPFQAMDSNRDSRPELLYGSTGVCSIDGDIAVLEGGRLTEVRMPDGAVLTVKEGCVGLERASSWGCEGSDLLLVTAEPEVDGRSIWTREHVRIAGRVAQVVRTDRGVSTAGRSYKFAVPDDVVPPPCPDVAHA